MTKINIENSDKRNCDLGPLINSDAFQNFKKYVDIASHEGKILYGGKIMNDGDLKYGYYVTPTIVEGVPFDNVLVKKELFLPFLCINEFNQFAEALNLCNKSEYGLTAAIYSKDKKEIDDFVNNIESGVVYVNRHKSLNYRRSCWESIFWRLEKFWYFWKRNRWKILSYTIHAGTKSDYSRIKLYLLLIFYV